MAEKQYRNSRARTGRTLKDIKDRHEPLKTALMRARSPYELVIPNTAMKLPEGALRQIISTNEERIIAWQMRAFLDKRRHNET